MKRIEALQDALDKWGLFTHVVWDINKRYKLLADPDLGQNYRCVVSAGGDGSIAAVLRDISLGGETTRIPIATIPMGNENLFAVEFGHQCGPERLAKAIHTLDTTRVDLGDAGGHLFALMASVGIDSTVVELVHNWRSQRRGTNSDVPSVRRVNRFSYIPWIVSAVTKYRYPRVILEVDDQQIMGCHAFVFNIGKYGAGLTIAPQAEIDDGMLDYVVLEKPGLLSMLGYILAILGHKHLHRNDVHYGRAESICIVSSTPLPVQIDGDPGGLTPMKLHIRPKAMRVIRVV